MLNFAINQMTTARSSFQSVLETAEALECLGVEVRNDLASELLDGLSGAQAMQAAAAHHVKILAVSEVSAFNDLSDRAFQQCKQLCEVAYACGAEAVSLIPRNDSQQTELHERRANLHASLEKLVPLFEHYNLQGYIEPLGFESSSLRYKEEVVQVLETLGVSHRFKLVHDTFHHHLAAETSLFPQHTGVVHISGVVDHSLALTDMQDKHRVLVNKNDVLCNIEQLSSLVTAGYEGPVSVESFAPQVHALDNPCEALLDSFKYIKSAIVASAA